MPARWNTLTRSTRFAPSRARREELPEDPFAEIVEAYGVLPVPDIIEFTIGEKWLNRPNVYPRQGTFLKLLFLQSELLTPYDYEVIEEWTQSFRETLDNGIAPDVLERVRINRRCPCGHDRGEHKHDEIWDLWCKQCGQEVCRRYDGRKWFREVVLPIGRRGSKGHIGAIAGGYILWNYLSKGNPQDYYGVDPDKRLTCLVFAGKKEQAKHDQWRDLKNFIAAGPCFQKYISRDMAESITIFAPSDRARLSQRSTDDDLATFEILPKESTLMSGRGPAAFCLDPETPVLLADLRWVPIGLLRSGDRLIGVDEYPEKRGTRRKLKESVVHAVRRTVKSALKFTFDDGSHVICSEDHQWLKQEHGRGGSYLWYKASRFKVGNKIRRVVEPWESDESFEAGYLAGFFDGEGCIIDEDKVSASSSVRFSQNPGVALETTLTYLKKLGFTPLRSGQGCYDYEDRSEYKCQQWCIRGTEECLRFLGQIRPRRLYLQADAVWRGRSLRRGNTPSNRVGGDRSKIITSIESLEPQELVDIETSTRTFIANGLISHNCMMFDEMAHVVASTGASRSAEEVWGSATPALDQFGKDAFIFCPSSPWQKTGQFFVEYEQCLQVEEDGIPSFPEKLVLQLCSWDIYEDWERAYALPLRPDRPERYKELKRAIQTYDDEMKALEKANPETFAVERRAHFAAVVDAYLNPDRIAAMFQPWGDYPLTMKDQGALAINYLFHGDPGKAGSNFGFAIAHATPPDENGLSHVVFDYVTHWEPSDFPEFDNEMHYPTIQKFIESRILTFVPGEVTFDQFASIQIIQNLREFVRKAQLPKQTVVYERTATAPLNWRVAETFKTALGLGLLHCPHDEQLEAELTYLQLLNKQSQTPRVDHPTIGPIQTKDVADACMWLTHALIGDQVAAFIGKTLSDMMPSASQPGGTQPFGKMFAPEEAPREQFAAFSSRRGNRGGMPTPGRSPWTGGAARGGRWGRR